VVVRERNALVSATQRCAATNFGHSAEAPIVGQALTEQNRTAGVIAEDG
jgi:hypothetical protein